MLKLRLNSKQLLFPVVDSAMRPEGSITRWISEVKDGNDTAVRELWQSYFSRLVRLARQQLSHTNTRVKDEEDVALSVFERFRIAAEQGRFPDLSDREGLWRLLVKMTANKSVDLKRSQSRLRRGGGNVRGESGMLGNSPDEHAINQVMSCEPTPEFVAIMGEQLSRLLELLEKDSLREVALAKMEGCSNGEVAKNLGCSIRTIERRLKLIRVKFDQEFGP